MEREFREVWQRLDVSFDDFIRTTEERHRAGVPRCRTHPRRRRHLRGHYEGWYCNSCEAFKQEKDLADGLCPVHRTKPDWIKEKNHFFRSRSTSGRSWTTTRASGGVEPGRRNEILNVIQAASRHLDQPSRQAWGIPLPFDSQSVVYVGSTPSSTTSPHWVSAARTIGVRAVVARVAARDRQGHHALPLRHLRRC